MSDTNQYKIGDRINYSGYTGIIKKIGLIPDSDSCVTHRGVPGYSILWDADGSESYVRQTHVIKTDVPQIKA